MNPYRSYKHGLSVSEQRALLDSVYDRLGQGTEVAVVQRAAAILDRGGMLSDKMVLILNNIVRHRDYSVRLLRALQAICSPSNYHVRFVRDVLDQFGALTQDQAALARTQIVEWARDPVHDDRGILSPSDLERVADLPQGWARDMVAPMRAYSFPAARRPSTTEAPTGNEAA